MTGMTIPRGRLAGAAFLLYAVAVAGAQAELDTTERTYVLFLDMAEVAEITNTELVVNAAQKSAHNPVLLLGDVGEWDSLGAGWPATIFYDGQDRIFKCWYSGNDHSLNLEHVMTGYATSTDGLLWTKPKLGVVEYGGNKKNNMCLSSNDVHVVKDPAERDPAKRYKMLAVRGESQ